MKDTKGIIILLLCQTLMFADVKMPALFSDNMALQKDKIINVWGFASPGEKVTIDINGNHAECVTNENGRWQTELSPMEAGGPYEMRIQGSNVIAIKNVLIGEVWLCSGQSNMEFKMSNSKGAGEEIAKADFPSLRLFMVKHNTTEDLQNDCEGEWIECTPETIGEYSAVAYYFAKNLMNNIDAPVGLIQSTRGGTPAEAWTSKEVLDSDTAFTSVLERWQKILDDYPEALKEYERNYDSIYAAWQIDSAKAVNNDMAPPSALKPPKGPGDRNTPSGLYNSMIYPLAPYTLRGIIWYQGEANARRGYQYRKLFPAMINNWRTLWKEDLPFYYVQLPNFARDKDTGWRGVREAQLMTLKMPNTGMAVTIDIGDPRNLHPADKREVGYRLSLIALNKLYDKDVCYSGPLYDSYRIEGSKFIIKFNHIAEGLMAKEGNELKGFMVAGDDSVFVPAKALIDHDRIIVWSDEIDQPVTIRYAWDDNPDCNLYNTAKLPASPFRLDDWENDK